MQHKSLLMWKKGHAVQAKSDLCIMFSVFFETQSIL